jgi:hypothetical protein
VSEGIRSRSIDDVELTHHGEFLDEVLGSIEGDD